MTEVDDIINQLIEDINVLSLKTPNKKLPKCKDKKITKLDLFKKLGGFDPLTQTTRWVNVNEFVGDYISLHQKNGGLGRGWEKMYKLVKVKKDKSIIWTWDATTHEKEKIHKDLDTFIDKNNPPVPTLGSGNTHFLIKIHGEHSVNTNRPIRQDIKNFYKIIPCVVCGNTSNLICDHKNDLYNDPRVLDSKTQELSDFQSLCNHCNLQKRQISKITRREGKRWGATNIPSLKHWGIDFTQGGETYDPRDTDAMVGTYWYDPVQFHRDILTTIFKKKEYKNTIIQTD